MILRYIFVLLVFAFGWLIFPVATQMQSVKSCLYENQWSLLACMLFACGMGIGILVAKVKT